MKSAPAITFDCRPSASLAIAVAALAALAIVAIAICGLPAWAKWMLVVAVGAYAAVAVLRMSRLPVGRCSLAGGHWRVRGRDGQDHAAVLLRAAVRGPLIVLVLLAGPLRRVTLVLLPDNCDADTRRRLRIELSRGGPEAAAQARSGG
jgi:toxin CptA